MRHIYKENGNNYHFFFIIYENVQYFQESNAKILIQLTYPALYQWVSFWPTTITFDLAFKDIYLQMGKGRLFPLISFVILAPMHIG